MKPRVYLINCPPGWIKTPPLAGEFLKQYLLGHGAIAETLDLNNFIFRLGRFDKKEWLSVNASFEKKLFSLIAEEYPHIIDDILRTVARYDHIGFTLYKRNQFFAHQLAQRIYSRYPKKHLIFGGPEVLFRKLHNKTLSPEFSWVVGEGELPIRSIIESNTKGIYEFQELDDLDTLPFCDFKGYTPNHYGPALGLFSSRGCIRRCSFCTECLLYVGFRQHSARYVCDQITHLIKHHGIKTFSFHDSLINANLRWLEEFCSLVIKKNLNIKWEAQAIIRNDFSHHHATLLKRSGCYNLFIGLESASDETLQNMKKGFSALDAVSFFSTLHKERLHFEISLIFGYAHSTQRDFETTLAFIRTNKKLIPKIAQANPFIDYHAGIDTPCEESLRRVGTFLKLVNDEKIPYTNSFINNLIDARCK